jgi:hypothetical protein
LLRAWCVRASRDPAYLEVAAAVVAGLVPSHRLFEPAVRRVSFGEAFAVLRSTRVSAGTRILGSALAAGFGEPLALARWLAHVSESGLRARRALRGLATSA